MKKAWTILALCLLAYMSSEAQALRPVIPAPWETPSAQVSTQNKEEPSQIRYPKPNEDIRGTSKSPFVIDAVTSDDDRKDRDDSRHIRHREARTNTISLLIATAALLVATVQAFFFLQQLRLMNVQIRSTEAMYLASNRPWISMDVKPSSKINWSDAGQGSFAVLFTLKNYGNGVATNVEPSCKLIPVMKETDLLVEMGKFSMERDRELTERSRIERKAEKVSRPLIKLLHPDSSESTHYEVTDDADRFKEARALLAAEWADFFAKPRQEHAEPTLSYLGTYYLLCAVHYQFAFDNTWHRTDAAFILGGGDGPPNYFPIAGLTNRSLDVELSHLFGISTAT